jgi:hypothetical protein
MSARAEVLALMVEGYLCGFNGGADVLPECHKSKPAAWRHGWQNGCDDRTGRLKNTAGVLRRRAEMILGASA